MNSNVKMVLLGQSSTGKTTIVHRLYYNNYLEKTESTVGAQFSVLNYDDLKVQVWDTAGQERFTSLIPMYYRDSDIILIVYDFSNMISIDKVEFYLDTISSNLNKNHYILIVGNKLDLVDEQKAGLVMDLINGIISKTNKNIECINISAKTGEHFELLERKVIELGKQAIINRENRLNIIESIDLTIQPNNSCSC